MKKEGSVQPGTIQLGYIHTQGKIGGADFFYHPVPGWSFLAARGYPRKKDRVSAGLF